jgi:putative hydrolase of HD superfamily
MESDAEHSWHLALLLTLLEDRTKSLDFIKIMKIALIHDLPEIYADDKNPYRDELEEKAENEKNAIIKLSSYLPQKLKNEFEDLFNEYENQTSPEAKVVKKADKLMPLIQSLCTMKANGASDYKRFKITAQEVQSYLDPFFEEKDVFKELYSHLFAECKNENVFY